MPDRADNYPLTMRHKIALVGFALFALAVLGQAGQTSYHHSGGGPAQVVSANTTPLAVMRPAVMRGPAILRYK